jgi:hypothetical protein
MAAATSGSRLTRYHVQDGGLVAGQQHGHQLIAQPAASQPRVRFILERAGKQRDHVGTVLIRAGGRAGTPAGQEGAYRVLQVSPGGTEAEVTRQRQPQRHRTEGEHLEHRLVLCDLEGAPELVQRRQLGVEQRLAEYVHRQRRHLADQVDRTFTDVPGKPLDEAIARVGDHVGEAGDALASEGG